MTRRTFLTLLAFVLALVMTAAACGGGDDDSSSSDDTAADETSTDDSADPSPSDDSAADESTTDDPDAGTEAAGGAGEGDEGSGGATAEGDVSTQLGVDREFTGDDSDAFCAEVVGMRDAGQDAAGVDNAAFADAMMAITPPAEIAAEWTNLFTVQKAIAADPSGDALAAMSPEELNAWGTAGNVVAAYLGDVCGLADGGG
ncbi:MAG TPA: hypothetical protein VFY82_13435 [Acidimicrobiales bacterium]|nr:hypothetical protein [Acidimicrobiales bacterium]